MCERDTAAHVKNNLSKPLVYTVYISYQFLLVFPMVLLCYEMIFLAAAIIIIIREPEKNNEQQKIVLLTFDFKEIPSTRNILPEPLLIFFT